MHHTTQAEKTKFTFFNLVTLDDLQLTQGQKTLRGVLRGIPHTIHVIPRPSFNLIRLLYPAKPARTEQ